MHAACPRPILALLSLLLLSSSVRAQATGPTTPVQKADPAAPARPGAAGARALRVEWLVEPAGLDARAPRFSWELDDARTGAVQSAWRILVASSPARLVEGAADLWDSGEVASSQTSSIRYAGAALASGTRCHWTVRTWDGERVAAPWSAPATFACGLLEASDVRGRWIGAPGEAPPGAPANNGYHSAFSDAADAYEWVQIDLGEDKVFDAIRLHPARPYDAPDQPGFLFPVQFKIWVSGRDPEFTREFQKFADRTLADEPNPGTRPLTVSASPTRYKLRYVRLGVSKTARVARGHGFALAELEVLDGETPVSRGARVTARSSIEEGAWSASRLTDGVLVSHAGTPPPPLPAPLLRKEFALPGKVARATLYASALGLYELRLNGAKVGDRALAPAWTDYRRRVEYQAYDVTALLAGENALAAYLGDGWYAGRIGLASVFPDVPARGIYGRKPRLFAQLEVELEGGDRVTVASDATWKCTTEGPIRASDLLDGEDYDGARAMPGFDRPGFDDAAWSAVEVAEDVTARLVGERAEPIRVVAEIGVSGIGRAGEGPFLFDFGENLVGRVRATRSAWHGPLVLRHAEVLEVPHLRVYTENLRSAAQTDRASDWSDPGGHAPRFTLHGFRYVSAQGLGEAEASASDLRAEVIASDLRDVGHFACADETLNALWRNAERSARGNLIGIPTDCPQRDERLGWMGDIEVFAPTACFQRDMAGFFTKWLQDVRDAQDANGALPDFAPHPFGKGRFQGAPGWGDAGVGVPWTAWVHYADRALLEDALAPAIRWVEYVRARNPDLVWRKERGNDYGDWLNGDAIVEEGWPRSGAEVRKDLFATAFFARSAELVARMARALGRGEEAERHAALARGIRAAFCAAFVDADAKLAGDTQAAYALALEFDLLPESMRARALEHLVAAIEGYPGGRFGVRENSGGFHTHHRILLALSRGGRHDLALELARKRTFPALGFAVENGATTMWERRDGWVPGRGYADPGMNSFNHYAFGAVGEWLIRAVAGIEPDEDHPGWERFTVRLRDQPGLERAGAEHRALPGRIVVAWERTAQGLSAEIVIPANTRATVVVPVGDPARVTSAGRPWAESAGVRLLAAQAGECRFDAPAGRHALLCELAR